MAPRPVTLRFSDFKSSEYRDLKGGDEFEPNEPSALLGWRGASRYYDPKYIEGFRLECQAVLKVREEYGLKNLHVMIPFCRTVAECEKVVTIMAEEGLRRGPDFKVWLMAEIPANIILADQFNRFVDGYSIGSNDLTMLVLGCDRDNDTVSAIFDERNLAVKRAVKHLIEAAHKEGKTVSICGHGAERLSGIRRIPRALRHRQHLRQPGPRQIHPARWSPRSNSASCWTPSPTAPRARHRRDLVIRFFQKNIKKKLPQIVAASFYPAPGNEPARDF
jgi:phosphoenolpyruvate synthase/pyruvate phosphate dikinase